ncbi:MAG TPA: hypothetical protein PL195_07440 [bacterium]|nr:hypothetical protein [bacterium]
MKRINLSNFIPADKSSLIRGYLFSLLTDEPVCVYYSDDLPNDIKTAFKCLRKFGKTVTVSGSTADISGVSAAPSELIDCENSATVMHILMGIAKYREWDLKLTGDRSLMRRDHSEFTRAGELYGACFVETVLSKESAQLKSFHLIAMLKSGGRLCFKSQTRRNTEELLKRMGVELFEKKGCIEVKPVKKLNGYELGMKLDPSSAFIAACSAIICGKQFIISAIYPEKLRMEPFKYLKKAGYSVSVSLKDEGYEVKWSGGFKTGLSRIVVSNNEVAKIIDEIPFIAYMSARVGCSFELKNGEWLRNKETDRISETVRRVEMFSETVETVDGFIVKNKKSTGTIKFPHSDDHRMEMLSKLIAVDKNIPFMVNDCYNVSFPGFLRMIEALGEK